MSLQIINIGTGPNTQTGDNARTWAGKSNANFQFLLDLFNANNKSVENRYVTPPNNTFAYCLSDQGNQTSGKIQFVGDAGDHSQVDLGASAYFEYLGTTNGNESDYKLMSADEVALLLMGYNLFSVKEKVDFTGAPATDTSVTGITINYNGTKIKEVIFSEAYSTLEVSKYTADAKKQRLKIFNLTKGVMHRDTIASISVASGGFYKAVLDEAINHADFDAEDNVAIIFDEWRADEEQIDGTAAEDATLTGAESIDLGTHTDAYFTLTGNTTISVTNTPAADKSFVRSWTVKSTATETLTLPGTWVVIGEYVADGSENFLTIRFSNFTTAGAKVVCYITQDD